MIQSLLVEVSDESGVGEARRSCARLSRLVALDEEAAGRVALVATEIATNLVRHATRGQRFVARTLAGAGVEVLGIDAGPGIADLSAVLRDGYSTTGTSGTGLGAVRRLADDFEIYSQVGSGTVVLARVLSPGAARRPVALDLGCIMTAMSGESLPGDGYSILETADRTSILVADGLGHGPDAAAAAAAAVRAFHEGPGRSPGEHVHAIHAALGQTRGAAIGVADVLVHERRLVYAGVGNIAGTVVSAHQTRSFVSHDGIAGHMLHRVQEFTYEFPADALLVMHSDGLTSRWNLLGYPGILLRDPAIIAAVLYRDAERGRDDTTVLVARARPAASRT
ncbi:MAG TPA: ATP-binding protein [Longimicrobiales bacterium]